MLEAKTVLHDSVIKTPFAFLGVVTASRMTNFSNHCARSRFCPGVGLLLLKID